MRFNGFSLKLCLNRTHFTVFCSHAGGLHAQARTKVPIRHWFHIVLTYQSKFRFYINGRAYSLICTEGPLSENEISDRTIDNDNDGYLILLYIGYVKFKSMVKFADIKILPSALTLYEIHGIIEQSTCIEQLSMGRYLLHHWTIIRWYSKYLFDCILF